MWKLGFRKEITVGATEVTIDLCPSVQFSSVQLVAHGKIYAVQSISYGPDRTVQNMCN